MTRSIHNTKKRCIGMAIASLLVSVTLFAQQAPSSASSTREQSPVVAPAHPVVPDGDERGTVIDSVVAVVNGDVILESDVDEERRFESIQPYRGAMSDFSRDRAVQRLIDRTLILQQAALEPEGSAVNDEELNKQIQTLRKDIPLCRQYHCETDEGWAKFLADKEFTAKQFQERWRKRMELLKLIEVRFRSGIRIEPNDIKNYYDNRMLPEYARQKVTPPALDTISSRIEEVLLQQQVGNLLRDWLKSLRAQGNVWVMRPGEVAP
jgi:peptidyl-prolyl cis-trans isomerase SurA